MVAELNQGCLSTVQGWCDTEIGKAEKDREYRHGDMETLNAEITTLEALKVRDLLLFLVVFQTVWSAEGCRAFPKIPPCILTSSSGGHVCTWRGCSR